MTGNPYTFMNPIITLYNGVKRGCNVFRFCRLNTCINTYSGDEENEQGGGGEDEKQIRGLHF